MQEPDNITVVAEVHSEIAGFVHVVLDKDEQWGRWWTICT
jgi:hypothetical protein